MSLHMFNWTSFPSLCESRTEIVIVYEDGETRRRVNDALGEAVREKSSQGLKCRVSEWKFSVLESAAMSRQAVQDAAQADVIVVGARGNNDLPEAVKAWLEEWVRQKPTSEGILIGLVDAAFLETRTGSQILGYLMRAAAEGNFAWQPSCFRSQEFEAASEPQPG